MTLVCLLPHAVAPWCVCLAAGYPVNPADQSLGKAHTVLSQATLGCALGVNPDRPRRGDEGLSDGFRVDAAGLIWGSMPDGVCVLDPAAKEVVAQVVLGVNTSNVCFGDGADVFVTGAGHVWRLRRKVPPPPPSL